MKKKKKKKNRQQKKSNFFFFFFLEFLVNTCTIKVNLNNNYDSLDDYRQNYWKNKYFSIGKYIHTNPVLEKKKKKKIV